jgi:hypothetical protein
MKDAKDLARTIDGHLYLLGWSRGCPRVTAFLQAVSYKHGQSYTLDNAPLCYLIRLEEFLKIYSQCEQLLKKFNLTWDSPIVTDLTAEYGGYKKMPILGWRHLYEALEHKYFLMEMPAPAAKKASAVKK